MACFLVPTAEAIVTTVATKVVEKKELKASQGAVQSVDVESAEVKIPFSRKLKWLTNLLWGGAVLLAFEHLWHGEISPFFPFLTSMSDASARAEMFTEMATTGVAMMIAVTVVWLGMLAVAKIYERKANKKIKAVKEK